MPIEKVSAPHKGKKRWEISSFFVADLKARILACLGAAAAGLQLRSWLLSLIIVISGGINRRGAKRLWQCENLVAKCDKWPPRLCYSRTLILSQRRMVFSFPPCHQSSALASGRAGWADGQTVWGESLRQMSAELSGGRRLPTVDSKLVTPRSSWAHRRIPVIVFVWVRPGFIVFVIA